MTSEVAKVIQQAGLVDDSTVKELRRWGAPITPASIGPVPDPEILPALIDRAMQNENMVQVRETDLEVLQQYVQTQTPGSLRLEEMSGKVLELSVIFGRTPLGEYILPWMGDKVSDLLEDCLVSLSLEGRWLSLERPKELFYGEQKVFTVWSAGKS
jgi:hypothetical protein